MPLRNPAGPDRPTSPQAALGALDDLARTLGKYTQRRSSDIRETTRALRSRARNKGKR